LFKVRGLNLVPRPAARIIAFMRYCFFNCNYCPLSIEQKN
jgi:hypothetical protein